MKSTEYHFVTRWRMPGTCEAIYAILEDPARVARFWPSLYRSIEEEKRGDANGVGRTLRAETRGFLPYTLSWHFEVVSAERPRGFSIRAWGDLTGAGTWTFAQDGDRVDVTYEWRVQADKPLLRYLSFLLRPLFSWNHDYVMARGEEGLRAELSRAAPSGA